MAKHPRWYVKAVAYAVMAFLAVVGFFAGVASIQDNRDKVGMFFSSFGLRTDGATAVIILLVLGEVAALALIVYAVRLLGRSGR